MNDLKYFDYASTTPVDPRVADKMYECLKLDGNFGNPCLLYTSPSPRDS